MLAVSTRHFVGTMASAEDTRKWYAMAHPSVGPPISYGVAWNFPTRAAAESAAVAECEQRARRKCSVPHNYYVDHDHCFAIIRVFVYRWKAAHFYFHTGPDLFFRADEHRNSLFQTEEEARRPATEEVREGNRHNGQWQQSSRETSTRSLPSRLSFWAST